ncbi:hypothetical protein H9P43_002658 [Blastocladiella emersonii ATCC 22665]|nr:hypothetical protein H9P43_002658 [Blastocladiella emersonii ATCC 22665]
MILPTVPFRTKSTNLGVDGAGDAAAGLRGQSAAGLSSARSVTANNSTADMPRQRQQSGHALHSGSVHRSTSTQLTNNEAPEPIVVPSFTMNSRRSASAMASHAASSLQSPSLAEEDEADFDISLSDDDSLASSSSLDSDLSDDSSSLRSGSVAARTSQFAIGRSRTLWEGVTSLVDGAASSTTTTEQMSSSLTVPGTVPRSTLGLPAGSLATRSPDPVIPPPRMLARRMSVAAPRRVSETAPDKPFAGTAEPAAKSSRLVDWYQRRIAPHILDSTWDLALERKRKHISMLTLTFSPRSLEAKYLDHSLRVSRLPLQFLATGMLLPVAVKLYIAAHAAVTYQHVQATCPSLSGWCGMCELVVACIVALGLLLLLTCIGLIYSPAFVAHRRPVWRLSIAVFTILSLVDVQGSACMLMCSQTDLATGTKLYLSSPLDVMDQCVIKHKVSDSLRTEILALTSAGHHHMASVGVSVFLLGSSLNLPFRQAVVSITSLIVAGSAFGAGLGLYVSSLFLSTVIHALDHASKSFLATYQREVVMRLSFMLNVRRLAKAKAKAAHEPGRGRRKSRFYAPPDMSGIPRPPTVVPEPLPAPPPPLPLVAAAPHPSSPPRSPGAPAPTTGSTQASSSLLGVTADLVSLSYGTPSGGPPSPSSRRPSNASVSSNIGNIGNSTTLSVTDQPVRDEAPRRKPPRMISPLPARRHSMFTASPVPRRAPLVMARSRTGSGNSENGKAAPGSGRRGGGGGSGSGADTATTTSSESPDDAHSSGSTRFSGTGRRSNNVLRRRSLDVGRPAPRADAARALVETWKTVAQEAPRRPLSLGVINEERRRAGLPAVRAGRTGPPPAPGAGPPGGKRLSIDSTRSGASTSTGHIGKRSMTGSAQVHAAAALTAARLSAQYESSSRSHHRASLGSHMQSINAIISKFDLVELSTLPRLNSPYGSGDQVASSRPMIDQPASAPLSSHGTMASAPAGGAGLATISASGLPSPPSFLDSLAAMRPSTSTPTGTPGTMRSRLFSGKRGTDSPRAMDSNPPSIIVDPALSGGGEARPMGLLALVEADGASPPSSAVVPPAPPFRFRLPSAGGRSTPGSPTVYRGSPMRPRMESLSSRSTASLPRPLAGNADAMPSSPGSRAGAALLPPMSMQLPMGVGFVTLARASSYVHSIANGAGPAYYDDHGGGVRGYLAAWWQQRMRPVRRIARELLYTFPSADDEAAFQIYYYRKLRVQLVLTVATNIVMLGVSILIGLATYNRFGSGALTRWDLPSSWWVLYVPNVLPNAIAVAYLACARRSATPSVAEGKQLERFVVVYIGLSCALVIGMDTFLRLVSDDFSLLEATFHQVTSTLLATTTLRLQARVQLPVLAWIAVGLAAELGVLTVTDNLAGMVAALSVLLSTLIIAAALALFYETALRRYDMLRRADRAPPPLTFPPPPVLATAAVVSPLTETDEGAPTPPGLPPIAQSTSSSDSRTPLTTYLATAVSAMTKAPAQLSMADPDTKPSSSGSEPRERTGSQRILASATLNRSDGSAAV